MGMIHSGYATFFCLASEMSVRCLLMAANYPGTRYELRGCVNDAENLSDFFMSSGAVYADHITILREPKKAQILSSLEKLVATTHSETIDRVFISFSGHGTTTKDMNGDEEDGYDEALVPVDHARNGLVSDDVLCELIGRINERTKVSVLFDCCHSGTALDLPFRFIACKRTEPCFVGSAKKCHPNTIMISGCKDAQTSADSYDKDRCEFSGAMTSSILDVLAIEPSIGSDAFALVTAMRVVLKERGMSQIPQLCASRSSDDHAVPSFLPPVEIAC